MMTIVNQVNCGVAVRMLYSVDRAIAVSKVATSVFARLERDDFSLNRKWIP
jgi:hypothetical protein